ncbi:type I-E CRISPR-associated protein Cse2/CasB [Marinobacterium sp. MBR-109]|jgi:CRISPR system Cascade subunit CasB|uniref:type I-E CRISPR-associated protein Cse2/CasB n=1 Tax=Marinobacterium sp. MBR-109 TaxID=3156462 RepID=UPI0033941FA2
MLDKRLHGADPASLMAWWHSLDDHRGERARLRRAAKPDDALLTDAFFHFLHRLPESWAQADKLYASASVATLLSHVRSDDKSGFAEALASGDKPAMSELRFRQLLKSRSPEEFFRRTLRAIRMLDGKVNVISLTQGILHWHQEYHFGPDANPRNRLGVIWAREYYSHLKA